MTADADLMRAWARIVRVKQALETAVEKHLKEAGALPLAWYDVLLELGRAQQGQLAPKDLEREVLLAQYNLSRLLDRMESDGLVERLAFPGDARRQLVRITPKGRKRRDETWPVYTAAVEKNAGQRLTRKEISSLLAILGKLLPH